jgi:hypothetical protein
MRAAGGVRLWQEVFAQIGRLELRERIEAIARMISGLISGVDKRLA